MSHKSVAVPDRSTGFRAINNDHAIEHVKFSVVFSSPLKPECIAAVQARHGDWREALPAVSPSPIDVEHNGQILTFPGVTFAFVRPDASPNWAMQVGGNRVVIECYLYTRWKKVWAIASSQLDKVLRVIAEQQGATSVISADLTVVDSFVTEDPNGSVAEVLRKSELIAHHVMDSGRLWHCNSGWFEIRSDQERILHNLNVSSTTQDGMYKVSILHSQHHQMRKTSIEEHVTHGFSTLSPHMEFMHQNNKNVMATILTAEMQKQIGLVHGRFS